MKTIHKIKLELSEDEIISENCYCIKYIFKPFISIIIKPTIKYIFKPIGKGLSRIYRGIIYSTEGSIFICCGKNNF
jgi:hypothetical protein